MVKNHCGHMVQPNWGRCGECGALVQVSAAPSNEQLLSQTKPVHSAPNAQPPSVPKPVVEKEQNQNCSHMVNPAWPRCGECGATVEIKKDDPAALAELEDLAKQFLDDGVMEDWEYDFLLQECQRLGVRRQSLDTMINSYQPLQQANASMSFDVGSIAGFKAGRSCQLPIMIENVSNQPFRSIEFFYRTLQEAEPIHHQLSIVPQNSKKSTVLPFEPKDSGQYSMSGVMKIQGFRGDIFCYQFEGINFQVISADSGPTNVTYNIDNSLHQRTEKYGSTAMQGNVNIQQAQGPTNGVFNRAEWKPLSLKPITEDAVADFRILTVAKGTFVIPQEFKGVVAMTRFKLSINSQYEVFGTTGMSLALGRDPQLADQQVLFEPCLPKEQYPANFQKSMDLSSRHCTFSIQGSEAYIVDQSTNGTSLNGQDLNKGSSHPLNNGTEVTLSKVLRFGVRTSHDKDGKLGYLLLNRKDNMPHKSHLLLHTSIGLWPQRPGWLGGVEGASVLLSMINGVACICNISADVNIGATPLKRGQAAPLTMNGIIVVNKKLIMVGGF